MQKINTPDSLFHDGDPFNNIQGTAVTAGFLNSVQNEIVTVIEGEQIVLDPNDNTQLQQAIIHLINRLAYTENRAKRYFFTQN